MENTHLKKFASDGKMKEEVLNFVLSSVDVNNLNPLAENKKLGEHVKATLLAREYIKKAFNELVFESPSEPKEPNPFR